MYSRRSWSLCAYIMIVPSWNDGTSSVLLPGFGTPPVPPGPWQVKQPSSPASLRPRCAALSRGGTMRSRTTGYASQADLDQRDDDQQADQEAGDGIGGHGLDV